jgi:hypothetical protein
MSPRSKRVARLVEVRRHVVEAREHAASIARARHDEAQARVDEAAARLQAAYESRPPLANTTSLGLDEDDMLVQLRARALRIARLDQCRAAQIVARAAAEVVEARRGQRAMELLFESAQALELRAHETIARKQEDEHAARRSR